MPVRVLRTERDAHVAADAPDANHGAAEALKVESRGTLGPADKRLLCAFDLRGLPPEATRIVEARLRLVPTRVAPDRLLRCHEVSGAWDEADVAWANQPAVGADHGTQDSGLNPQVWDVTATAQARFPVGRLSLRVRDDAEGALLGHLQEYASREGAGTPPELVVTYEAQRAATLASTVTPRQRAGHGALPGSVRVRRTAARFQQVRRVALAAADGAATRPAGVAYDPGRDALWVTDPTARRVRRYARATLALEQEYDVPDGFLPVGCAYDGASLWLSDDASGAMTIRRFAIGATALTQEASHPHPHRTVLAWDGQALWSADPVVGEVYRHRMDDALTIEATFPGLPEVLGLAFPTDAPGEREVLCLERSGSGPGSHAIARRRASDLALLERHPYRGLVEAGPLGLALVPGPASGHLVNLEEDAGDVLVRPGLALASLVRPGRIPASADLASAVRPGRIPGSAALASRVRANVPGVAVLASGVVPRVAGAGFLASQVRPRETLVAVGAALRGIIATPMVVDPQDFLGISVEAGSSIVHTTRRGERRALRRVVQLIENRETVRFPRALTSEAGRGSTHDLLRRGDAILYATGPDRFRPGDTVTWQGLEWVVAGLLAWEMVGDVRLYQEVGLRRLGLAAQARLQGTIAEAQEGEGGT